MGNPAADRCFDAVADDAFLARSTPSASVGFGLDAVQRFTATIVKSHFRLRAEQEPGCRIVVLNADIIIHNKGRQRDGVEDRAQILPLLEAFLSGIHSLYSPSRR